MAAGPEIAFAEGREETNLVAGLEAAVTSDLLNQRFDPTDWQQAVGMRRLLSSAERPPGLQLTAGLEAALILNELSSNIWSLERDQPSPATQLEGTPDDPSLVAKVGLMGRSLALMTVDYAGAHQEEALRGFRAFQYASAEQLREQALYGTVSAAERQETDQVLADAGLVGPLVDSEGGGEDLSQFGVRGRGLVIVTQAGVRRGVARIISQETGQQESIRYWHQLDNSAPRAA